MVFFLKMLGMKNARILIYGYLLHRKPRAIESERTPLPIGFDSGVTDGGAEGILCLRLDVFL